MIGFLGGRNRPNAARSAGLFQFANRPASVCATRSVRTARSFKHASANSDATRREHAPRNRGQRHGSASDKWPRAVRAAYPVRAQPPSIKQHRKFPGREILPRPPGNNNLPHPKRRDLVHRARDQRLAREFHPRLVAAHAFGFASSKNDGAVLLLNSPGPESRRK